MATNIGTGPQDIPLNQFLGEMAFMDQPPRKKCYVAVGAVGGSLSNPDAGNSTETFSPYGTTTSAVFADLGGDWDISTQKFTAPLTGVYQFNQGCRFSVYGSNITYLYMTAYVDNYRAGGQRIYLWSPGTDSGGTYKPHNFSGAIYMNEGDTINPTIRITTTATSSSTVDGGIAGQSDTYFDIYYVG